MYLAVIMDWHSRCVLSWRLCQSMMTARYMNPLDIGMYVMSVAHTS